MPTFSAEALQGFKDALSATASGFFGLFKRLLDFILSSPVLFFAVAIPIAGLVFWLIFCLVRNLGERDLETSMGARLYSKELDGAFTNGALITRNAFRKAKKCTIRKTKSLCKLLISLKGAIAIPMQPMRPMLHALVSITERR